MRFSRWAHTVTKKGLSISKSFKFKRGLRVGQGGTHGAARLHRRPHSQMQALKNRTYHLFCYCRSIGNQIAITPGRGNILVSRPFRTIGLRSQVLVARAGNLLQSKEHIRLSVPD